MGVRDRRVDARQSSLLEVRLSRASYGARAVIHDVQVALGPHSVSLLSGSPGVGRRHWRAALSAFIRSTSAKCDSGTLSLQRKSADRAVEHGGRSSTSFRILTAA